MRKIIAAFIICFTFISQSSADELQINENVPDKYVVVKGDTLWGIATMFLKDPWKWQDIWYMNPQVENPHLIYPGDLIGFITVDGETRMTTIVQGEGSNTLVITQASEQVGADGVVKLRPTARVTPILGAIPAIPREHIEGFLSGNRILNSEELKSAPYIVSGSEGRLIMGAGDKIYGRGEFSSELPVYQIYRIGKKYKDPNTREQLGFEAIELGTAKISDLQGDIATFILERSNQQIGKTDRILPSDQAQLETYFYPSEPPQDIEGKIIDVTSAVSYIGQFDVVLMNIGAREGVKAGNVFKVSRQGDKVRDPVNGQKLQMPDEEGGLLMTFRVFDKMSYGIILTAKIPMKIGDNLSNPGF